MSARDPEDSYRSRSKFIRSLILRQSETAVGLPTRLTMPPRVVVQYWNDLDNLPGDVSSCMDSWKMLNSSNFEFRLFDELMAASFIQEELGSRHSGAFKKCYHPAMQSDYFRLCYISVSGGGYIDADDVYQGLPICHLFDDGLLKIQPLCYDMSLDSMVPVSSFTNPERDERDWIYYFNNNPLIAGNGHPLVEQALENATIALESDWVDGLPEIQSTAGPGNLTKTIFEASFTASYLSQSLLVLRDWDSVAVSKWPLSYRQDKRNWRLSNRMEMNSDTGKDLS